MSNSSNGLITKIWGPPAWITFHSVTFGYPINPTEEDKKVYLNFFKTFGKVLPCKYCRDSYNEFISKGNTKLSRNVLKNRKTITLWGYLLHQEVNKKLGVDYGVTYNDMVSRYESYRAKCVKGKEVRTKVKGCVVPLNKNTNSYYIVENKDAPLIPFNVAIKFVDYAKSLKIPDNDFHFINFIKNEEDLSAMLKKKNNQEWCRRNNECSDIIRDIRQKNISSIDPETGLPSFMELKLILRFSSLIPRERLYSVIQKLPGASKIKKFYKLVG